MNSELILFYPEGHQRHFERGHPERPERVEMIRQALESAGWWGAARKVEPLSLGEDVLARIHTSDYLQMLQKYCEAGEHLDPDTYTTPDSWNLAHQAASGAAAVAAAVWGQPEGTTQRGFALTRPPGHHATAIRGMGFCLINNIAVAAEYLLNSSSDKKQNARRLAILDLDLHHGNGTQNIFWRRSDVLYISTHQAPFYPGSGHLEEIGAGAGEGLTANIPLPAGTGDQGFRAVMEEVIIPLLDRYLPEMLLVSYGFDVHWRDPLGSLLLSSTGLADLIKSLVIWADANCHGRIALILEGGYDLYAAASASLCVTEALLGVPWQDALGPSPYQENNAWQPVVRRARQIWKI